MPGPEAAQTLRRLDERNRREDANTLTVTVSALDDFVTRFEPPPTTRARPSTPDN